MLKNADKKDLLATLVNQLWKVIAGPLILIFIPLYLTPVEQGYWYTFTSISALSIFADLGFSTIILQFVAHEFVYLHFKKNRLLTGDEMHLWKLASFFRFSVNWLLRVIGLVFPIIVIGGYFFLSSKSEDISWEGAWIIYSIVSGLMFFNSSILSFFEGCNSVSLLQSMRFKIVVCNSLAMLISLSLHFNLYSLSISLIVSTCVASGLIIKNFSRTIFQLWELSKEKCYDWWPEFSTLIWRYAISWCSGYFIFQLFTPLAFKYHGAIFAGKIGISIAMWTAGFNIASSWITAITPKLNMLISKRQWEDLDVIFKKNLYNAMLTMFIGGSSFILVQSIFADKIGFFQRVLNTSSMTLLFLCWLCQLYVNSVAVYLRAHKKEPLMLPSLFGAIYVSITTYMCAKFLQSDFLFLGFFTSFFWGIPIVIKIMQFQRAAHK